MAQTLGSVVTYDSHHEEEEEAYEVVALEKFVPLTEYVVELAHDGVLDLFGRSEPEEGRREDAPLPRLEEDAFVPSFCRLQHLDHITYGERQLVAGGDVRLGPVGDG